MSEELNQLIEIGTIVSATVAVGTIVWKTSQWASKVIVLLERQDSKQDTVIERLGSIGTEIVAMRGSMAAMNESMLALREDNREIRQHLLAALKSNSPRLLSERGGKMAEFLKAEEWASGIADSVMGEVADKQPYQVEQFSRSFVESGLDDQMKERVAACAYEFGHEKEAVMPVLWVVLRNELFKRTAPEEARRLDALDTPRRS